VPKIEVVRSHNSFVILEEETVGMSQKVGPV
jgi:hypothetical protein